MNRPGNLVMVDCSSKPTVLAILPTLAKNFDLVQKCIEAIRNSDFDHSLALLVIVNNPEIILEPIEDVTVLNPGINLGFNGGLNFGSKLYQSDFIWVIQDDILVNPNTLNALYDEIISDLEVSMVTPRRIDSEGRFPVCGGWNDNSGLITGAYSEPLREDSRYNIPRHLDWIVSSGLLIRREVWEILGGYDLDLYPLSHGDVDFCDRATTQGYKFSLSSTATIEHEHKSSSTPSLLRDFAFSNSSQIFSQKKQRLWKTTSISPLVAPEMIAKIAQRASVFIPKLSEFASHEFLQNKLLQTKADHDSLHIQFLQTKAELREITQSRIWRISKPYRLLRTYLKNL